MNILILVLLIYDNYNFRSYIVSSNISLFKDVYKTTTRVSSEQEMFAIDPVNMLLHNFNIINLYAKLMRWGGGSSIRQFV